MDDMYIDRLVNDYNSMRRERDEAQAEVERLRGDRQTAINEALAVSDACWRMEQEVLQRRYEEAKAETQRLIELNRSHVATLCEAQRNQVEALKAERDLLKNHYSPEAAAKLRAELASAQAEIEVLRGVGCREAKLDEPQSGPCGVCLRCAEERGARWALNHIMRWSSDNQKQSVAEDICRDARRER
jgi:hypothetical protein